MEHNPTRGPDEAAVTRRACRTTRSATWRPPPTRPCSTLLPRVAPTISSWAARKLTNPRTGLVDTHGNDRQQFSQPPAPTFASAWEAGVIMELYWMALPRDTGFMSYSSSARQS